VVVVLKLDAHIGEEIFYGKTCMCKILFVDEIISLCEQEKAERNKNKNDHRDALLPAYTQIS
jgi:hypothetical protein